MKTEQTQLPLTSNTNTTSNIGCRIFYTDSFGYQTILEQVKAPNDPTQWFFKDQQGTIYYTNLNVAEKLGINPSTLNKYYWRYWNQMMNKPLALPALYHPAVPTLFSSSGNVKKVKQLLWSQQAVEWLTDIVAENKSKQTKKQRPVSKVKADKTVDKIIETVVEGVHTLNRRMSEIKEENNKLKTKLNDVMVSHKDWSSSSPDSLKHYVNKLGIWDDVNNLTKSGLLNSDQVLSLFSSYWLDEKGKLVGKARFQRILRAAFHLPASTHEAPTLRSQAVRDNLSVVCHVVCPKWDNPVDSKGAVQKADNPAYKVDKQNKHVRPQVRYSFKGVDWLRKNWTSMLKQVNP